MVLSATVYKGPKETDPNRNERWAEKTVPLSIIRQDGLWEIVQDLTGQDMPGIHGIKNDFLFFNLLDINYTEGDDIRVVVHATHPDNRKTVMTDPDDPDKIIEMDGYQFNAGQFHEEKFFMPIFKEEDFKGKGTFTDKSHTEYFSKYGTPYYAHDLNVKGERSGVSGIAIYSPGGPMEIIGYKEYANHTIGGNPPNLTLYFRLLGTGYLVEYTHVQPGDALEHLNTTTGEMDGYLVEYKKTGKAIIPSDPNTVIAYTGYPEAKPGATSPVLHVAMQNPLYKEGGDAMEADGNVWNITVASGKQRGTELPNVEILKYLVSNWTQ